MADFVNLVKFKIPYSKNYVKQNKKYVKFTIQYVILNKKIYLFVKLKILTESKDSKKTILLIF